MTPGSAAAHVVVFVAGALLVLGVLGSAVRTVVLPRATPVRLDRAVFLTVRTILRGLLGRRADFATRDRVFAFYAPIGLLGILASWLIGVFVAYLAMQWGLGHRSLKEAFELSGSSAFTLGFELSRTLPSLLLTFTEAALALFLLALLIAYLPTIYAAFSRREAMVASLETQAGSPPAVPVFLERLARIRGLGELSGLWDDWQRWFVEIQENHTSFPAVVFLRSPQRQHSWVTAAGCVLDTAAIVVSTLDLPRDPAASLCLRAGWLSLRRIAAAFQIPFANDPSPTDPISIRREEYDEVVDRLERSGLPLRADRDRCWRDFAGWRVNYDTVVLDLATLVSAPPAPWSSDRAGPWQPWFVGAHMRGRVAMPPPPH
jgi:hypothetical protein